ncbi:MAG: TIR domain-containing protein [Ruminococcaceae bacterium]|nr:TIR domain-containing protein [Oscillospiraceae bacterium]
MQIFISHSSENAKEAEAVCGIIEKAGHKCFLAPRDIRSGHEYAEEIIDGIDSSSAVVLLLSEAANSSPHVLREIERAVSKKLSIIVYKLEDVNLSKSMEYFLMTHQWVNEKQDKGYKEILNCINGLSDNKDSDYAEPEQITAAGKSGNKGLIVKTAVTAAVIIVCVVASILIFGNSDKPESVMNENIATESGEVTPETEEITESEAPTEAENTGEASETPAETSAVTSSEALAETLSEATTEAASENVSENTEESVTQDTAETATPTETETENTAPITEAEASETEAAAFEPKAELGDSFKLGEYLGEPIKWRVIQLSEDGKTAVVIADNILTMKAFDAAECGKYNSYNGENYWNVPPQDMTKETERLVRGDNSWELSNLRTWLNSSRDNITYTDQEPNSRAMSELKNGYNTEAGFLKSFNKTEIKAVLTTQVTTNGTVTEDKVYLLSKDELYLLDEADVSTYAVPTESAVEQDQSGWYTLNIHEYRVRDHYWWLRDPNTDTASEVYIVNNSYAGDKVFSHNVGLEGYGVRPVMTVDLTADCIVVE